MLLTIKIKIDNATFENAGLEVSRILRRLSDEIESCASLEGFDKHLFDINGNRVGEVKAKGE